MALIDHSLGRSLQDVFSKTPRREPSKGYLEVELGLILPPGNNPRTDFDEAALQELAASIRTHGVLQPIVVIKREVGYEVLSGERRYRAAKLAGLAKVPVVVREGDDPRLVAELRLIENVQRQDLNPMELARAYRALLDEHQLTHEVLAERVAKDRATITNTLRLLSLPEPLQAMVADGRLGAGHAKALLSAGDPGWQTSLAQRALDEGLSVRAVEALAKAGPPKAGTAVTRAGKAPHLKELEENLYHLFQTRVQVVEKSGGKGHITLQFDSKDHFQRIVAIMDRFVKQANKV